MACIYEFVPGSEPCYVQTITETLGRAAWTHPNDSGTGIVLRTRDLDGFNETLNGAQLIIELKTLAGNVIDPNASDAYIASLASVFYTVRVLEDGVETFNNDYFASTTLVGSPPELLVIPTNLPATIQSDINSANLGVGIVTVVDDVYDTILTLPTDLRTTTLTISGVSGLSQDISPADQYRTGPIGPIVYVSTSQNTDIDSDGATFSVGDLKLMDLDTCTWNTYDPLNP